MKHSKKLLTLALCLLALCATLAIAYAAEPRTSVMACPMCNSGEFRSVEEVEFLGTTETESCQHGFSKGYDTCELYLVTVTMSCKSCYFSMTEDPFVRTIVTECHGR